MKVIAKCKKCGKDVDMEGQFEYSCVEHGEVNCEQIELYVVDY